MSNHGTIPLFRDFPQLAKSLAHVPLATLPTPVEKLDIGTTGHAGSLHIKRDDLSGAVYGGNKVRKLEFLFGDILRTNAKEVMTLGFAGSNHALATAIYAKQLGLKCTSLLMPQVNAHYVRRNLLAGHHYEAQLRHYANLPLLSLGMIAVLFRGKWEHGVFPRLIPAGGSCPVGLIGYVNAALELRDQIAAGELPEPDRIYVPLGSMGTSAGLMIGLRAAGLKTRVVPVRVIEERMASRKRMLRLIGATAALLRKLDPTFPSVSLTMDDLLIRDDCLGEGYARFTRRGVDAAALMQDRTGIVLNGCYSAKAFSALLADAEAGILDGKTALFWNTYNSRDLSGVTGGVDYRQLPGAFHRYFEEDVQPLDRMNGVSPGLGVRGSGGRGASTGSPAGPRSRVVVAGCPSYSPKLVGEALAEVTDALGGMSGFVKQGQTVLLKPNLFSAHPPEHAVTTHPELVRQMVLACTQAGAGRIWVGDSPVGAQDEKKLWSLTGMEQAIAGTAAELKSWHAAQKPLPCDGHVLAVPEWLDEVDVLISLPKLKVHCLTTLTCGLKNVYGLVSGPAKLQFHVKYPSPLAMSAFLVKAFSVLKPHLTIADAVTAMEGNGPAYGRPLPVGVLLAGRDAVALDAVGCRALGIAPVSVPMIRLAAEDGLGHMDAAMIDCTGSGVSRLQSVRMKPSLARFLKWIPEPLFRLSTMLWQLRPRVMPKACARCGNCVAACPKRTIEFQARTGYPRVNQRNCIACFCCMESCPEGAIALQLRLASLLCVARQRRRRATR